MPSNSPLSPLPPNIELVTEYDALVIRRTWKTAAAYFLIFFALAWNAFMVAWMTIAFKNSVWIMAAFGSIHAAVGVGLIYFTVALFRNKTDIRITGYTLSVKHYPLPWFGQKEVPVDSIKQLYCKQRITRSKNGVNVSYTLNYIDHNGRDQKLLSGFNEPDQVLFIENEIEKTLGIKNQSVVGEFKS